jgi:4-hydroxymandelate oxidase
MTQKQAPIHWKDHAKLAHAALDDNAWSYFSGGAAEELTLGRNIAAWNDWSFLPRVLSPLRGCHTRIELMGKTWPTPFLLAPIAYQRMAHADGEVGSACAAAAQASGMVLSSQASQPLEDVARAMVNEPNRGPLWAQLYWNSDEEKMLAWINRVELAGYEALVLTADAPVHGVRDRERRANFKLPAGVSAVNLPSAPALASTDTDALDSLWAQAPTWQDVEWLQARTRLPVLLKGVLHPEDARQAQKLGLAGVIVSNHGGRTLDTAVSTAFALPRVREAVGPDFTVLVDGGIRRGTDALKAMALGANAVLIGRPYVYGLAHGGAFGVAHVLRLLRDELVMAMALCGCTRLEQAGPHLLVKE